MVSERFLLLIVLKPILNIIKRQKPRSPPEADENERRYYILLINIVNFITKKEMLPIQTLSFYWVFA